jgi:UDP-2-acetamido-2-deoxy-ribo-hexuluronate aminotransferase
MEFVDLKAQYRSIRDEVDARIQRVLEHGQYILGPEVAELERQLAEFVGAKHCVTCASGTDALLISLMALGIGPGDEVVTTPFSFIATVEVIVLLGAHPVLVDIEPDSCNLDAALVDAAITPRTRAIVPVSLYGQPADMDEVNAIAACRGIPVIEDAAQSFGATYRGRRSCNLSTIGCTSFFPSKPLGCYGDGGAMITSDDALAAAAREIRVHGQPRRYYHSRIGLGGRMDTLQCAIVLAKFGHFESELARRAEAASRYRRLLDVMGEQVGVAAVRTDRTSAYAQYTIFVPDRDRVAKHLAGLGIPTAVHYPLPIHRQPAYEQIVRGAPLPNAERRAGDVLCLPMHAYLDVDSQERVVAGLNSALAAVRQGA